MARKIIGNTVCTPIKPDVSFGPVMETAYDGELRFTPMGPIGSTQIQYNVTGEILKASVIWDGEQYECNVIREGDDYFFGDFAFSGLPYESNEEPFFIAMSALKGTTGVSINDIQPKESATHYTREVKIVFSVAKKIDEAYMPDSFAELKAKVDSLADGNEVAY